MNKHDIKKIRKSLGMTQKQFADFIGYSLNAVKYWESGNPVTKRAEEWINAKVAEADK